MRILTAEAMREVDRSAIEGLGIPSLVLMENAALGVVDALGEASGAIGAAESAAIFCGPGNNGGDGLAIARHLSVRGWEVAVFLATGGKELSGDAGAQLAICRKMGLAISEITAEEDAWEALAAAGDLDLIVDALFGTGLARPLSGLFELLVEGINDLPRPCVAVDLPSGLNGSRPEPLGPHVWADLTVTFAAPKIAHVLAPAADAVGELVVADLGIPPRLVDEIEEENGRLELLVEDELAGWLPPRPRDAHKGTFGHALLVAGSPGKAGAAILAARAAVRSGAGLVTVAVPEPILETVDLGSLESMTLALSSTAMSQALLQALEGKAVLAVGPGLGQDEPAVRLIRELVMTSGGAELPLVLDADGINAFAGHAVDLTRRKAPTVLTPHPGELGRLLGISAGDVQADRLGAVRRAARETGAIVVLKGGRTLIADSEGNVWVNPTGNPGMATGGSGDVLTGLAAGLIAQREAYGLEVLDAVLLAVFLHGLAGDLAVAEKGENALAAGDLIEFLPAAFARLAGE
jgi:ADP-dependent NAD(P)H-hydrate dehydratase / NAD(P)H-hydrate epimerase